MLDRVAREILRSERVPIPILWLLAGDGMAAWYRWLARGLSDHLGGKTQARQILSRVMSRAFTRRYESLRKLYPSLPDDPRALALTMHGLYRAPSARHTTWVLDAIGGPPRNLQEKLRAFRLVAPLDYKTRWIEVATHLGEVLIALTDRLPLEGLPNASSVLGQICFDAGVRYGERARDRWHLPKSPASAIEVLRVGEYVFRVNPEHTSASDEARYTGMIEGSACPWFIRPGWHRMHCGIFGQFQAGVSSVFELKYKLTKTIPRHGGDRCRVDLVPLGTGRLRRAQLGADSANDPDHR